MKTRLLILSFLIFVSTSHGQTIFLKLGPSFSMLTWKSNAPYSDSYDNTPNFNIGFDAIAGVNYLNFKYFNLSSGIGCIQKSGYNIITIQNGEYGPNSKNHITTRLNFLTINTTFNLKIPIKKSIEPNIFIGPRLDYLFSKNDGILKQVYDVSKINKVIYGILCGAGINFNVKRFQLGLVVDYYFNINKLVDYTKTYNLSNGSREITEKIYDNTFTINALIGFKF